MYPPSHVYVVGASSRLFQSLDLGVEFTAVSGRNDALATLPDFPPGARILIFADPPDLHQTQALLLSLLQRVPVGSGCRVVYISTISATFGQSAVFPYEGPYAHKKRMAEMVLRSRSDLDVCIVRVGNVFDHGGWQAVRTRTRWAWLPAGFSSTKVSDSASVRAALEDALRADPGHHVVDAWRLEPTARIFRRVVSIPGLLLIYKIGWAKFPFKLAGRLLKLLKVYLPSHDDLNGFLVK
jgi:hypothetical protein